MVKNMMRLLLLTLIGASVTRAADLPDFDGLWNFQDVTATETKLRELLPQAEASGDASYHLQLLTQIARTLGLRRDFKAAHALLDTVAAHLTADVELAHIRYLLERGRVFNSSGDPEAAKPLLIDAWKRASAAGADYYAVDAAHMMGIVETPERQISWNTKAMQRAEASDDPRTRTWLGPLYHNTAMTYLDFGEYRPALALFEKDWELRRQSGSPLEIRIAKWCVAHTLRKMSRVDDALALQRELADEVAAAGETDGYVFEEIAECLLAQGKPEQARPFFQRAYQLLKDEHWIQESEPKRLERLRTLAEDS